MARTASIAIAAGLLAGVVSCTHGAPERAPSVELDARRYLIRASLDLRGVRPTRAEHREARSSHDAASALVDGFVDDARFGQRVRDLFAPVLRTRVDEFTVSDDAYGDDEAGFATAVADEPLRLIQHIAENDLPYTTLVTADYTMANGVLAERWPLDYEGDGEAWAVSRYTDGRIHAGVLSMSSIYWRFASDGANHNRGRANALTTILLCENYLERPVDFPRDFDLTDDDAIANAVQKNTACQGCHATLDPFASYLFGFRYVAEAEAEYQVYHPEREHDWMTATGAPPAFYGQPGFTLRDLGRQIASDPRFVECAVERAYEMMLGRKSTLADRDALNVHREAFLAGGLTLRALFRSVARDPAYRGLRARDRDPEPIAHKLVSPDLLASEIEDLTGYRMTVGDRDVVHTDESGLRTLAGGADPIAGERGAKGPNATVVLAGERIAEAAAWGAVADDTIAASLFPGVDLDASSPDAAAIDALLDRLFGARDAGPAPADVLALWGALFEASGDARAAWAGVLSALLRDPEIVLY